ncbi:hypothetical protein [Clostridium sp. HV4-5-A1G]|jgi:hypothetical protein|uniref:hypothetical protein n=1 Tax=Clostridium sp. HV4-5-A1G TaxID=2004595 RepID=UPI00123BFF92|nr:hypothetical protein [Clostridium sp. HV4-5-A1G]KAA8664628.1 hypothetical protein F3O63_17555 [Clostridium sp. HV4-5-A1G]
MIKIAKKKGSVQLVPLFFILLMLVGIFSLFLYENVIANDKYSRFKNQLEASNLAVVRNINQRQLKETGKITFKETDLVPAFNTFKEYLIKNYSLGSNLNSLSGNTSVIGKVSIKDLRIYSVQDGKLEEWDYTDGMFNHVSNPTGKTPNGKSVEQTSIYSKINLNTYTVLRAENSGTSNLKSLDIEAYDDFVIPKE